LNVTFFLFWDFVIRLDFVFVVFLYLRLQCCLCLCLFLRVRAFLEYLLFLVFGFVFDALGEPPPWCLPLPVPLPLPFVELLAGGKALEGNIPRSVFSSFFSSRPTSTISFCDCDCGGGFFELTPTTPPFALTGALGTASAATIGPVAFVPLAFDPGWLYLDAGGGKADSGGGKADSGGGKADSGGGKADSGGGKADAGGGKADAGGGGGGGGGKTSPIT
jgi:hypothetical protein